jgi:hypothetical protein
MTQRPTSQRTNLCWIALVSVLSPAVLWSQQPSEPPPSTPPVEVPVPAQQDPVPQPVPQEPVVEPPVAQPKPAAPTPAPEIPKQDPEPVPETPPLTPQEAPKTAPQDPVGEPAGATPEVLPPVPVETPAETEPAKPAATTTPPVAVPAPANGAAAAAPAKVWPEGFRDLASVSAALTKIAADHPNHTRTLELGALSDGRKLPALLFGAEGPLPMESRPCVLLLGSLDGQSPSGGTAVLAVSSELLREPASLPQGVAFAVVPAPGLPISSRRRARSACCSATRCFSWPQTTALRAKSSTAAVCRYRRSLASRR